MRILIIGGTGLVGSYLLPELNGMDYELFALTRSEEKKEKLGKLGITGILGDIRQSGAFRDSLPDALDIIVNLASPGVTPGKRISPKRKRELREDTNAIFRNSMDLAIEYAIPVILPGGTSYRTRGNEVADESWPTLRAGLTEIGLDTDVMVKNAIDTGRPEIIQLMYGKIYGNGGLFRFMYNMMARGRSMIIGKGDNYIPNIHAADAASAIIKTIEKLPVGEKILIADDTPATQKDFTGYMAELMKQKPPRSIPGFIIRLALGKDFYHVLRMDCRVSNAKAKALLGWEPMYPSYREGLEATLREMKEKDNYFA
jgi:nucleoside-diphosphate-sugar epimerase